MKILRDIFLCILTAFVLSACTERNSLLLENADGSRIPPDTLISVGSSETLGQWYSYVISNDGEVVYMPIKYAGYGKPSVTQEVPIKSRISQEQLEQIVREFENQEFFSLNNEYLMGENDCEGRVLDAGIRTVSIEIGGRKKTVRWKGCLKKGKYYPPQLFSVIEKVLQAVNAAQST